MLRPGEGDSLLFGECKCIRTSEGGSGFRMVWWTRVNLVHNLRHKERIDLVTRRLGDSLPMLN